MPRELLDVLKIGLDVVDTNECRGDTVAVGSSLPNACASITP